MTVQIQPSPYGSVLSFSGSVSSSSLAEATVPLTGVQLRHRLGRLHLTEGIAGVERASDHRRVDVHDVAECVLGVVGDADGGDITLDTNPFVVLGIAESVRTFMPRT